MDERTRYFRRLQAAAQFRAPVERPRVVAWPRPPPSSPPMRASASADAFWAGRRRRLGGAGLVALERPPRAGRRARPAAARPGAARSQRLAAAIERFPAGRTVLQEVRRQQGPVRAARLGGRPGLGPAGPRVADAGRAWPAGSPGPGEAAVLEAATAEQWLRDLGQRVASVERAIPLSPPDQRPALESSHESLADQFTEGVDRLRAAGRRRGELGGRGRSADRGRAAPGFFRPDRGDRPAARRSPRACPSCASTARPPTPGTRLPDQPGFGLAARTPVGDPLVLVRLLDRRAASPARLRAPAVDIAGLSAAQRAGRGLGPAALVRRHQLLRQLDRALAGRAPPRPASTATARAGTASRPCRGCPRRPGCAGRAGPRRCVASGFAAIRRTASAASQSAPSRSGPRWSR